ncbi:tRNA (adenosine(37)-N6)-dimethylallyltransferase MiaA [Thermodesulfobacteriota bacterium]
MNESKSKIVVVCGPTGSGKTGIAIELSRMFTGEIIGADSMQIYRYMDIGTAKPTRAEQAQVRHHMIDIVDPDENFSAARFAKMAAEKIDALVAWSKAPFVVGGTGLYLKALVHGLFSEAPTMPELRSRLRRQLDENGAEVLYEKLKQCDPAATEKIHPHDTFRIIRALEVYELTGKPISAHHREHGFMDEPFRVLKIGLDIQREKLYERIDRRVDRMVADGLVKEVESLLDRGYAPTLNSMQSIGYLHVVGFLAGRMTWQETLRTLKRDTRRYAKRQMTWFRRDADIHWFKPKQTKDMSALVAGFLA